MDPFARKEWYVLKAPAMFQVRNAGRTLINKTAGQSKQPALCLCV